METINEMELKVQICMRIAHEISSGQTALSRRHRDQLHRPATVGDNILVRAATWN